MTRRSRTSALRRYPALGFLGIAAVLALLLPSALHIPLSGPTAQAEVAPINGRSNAAGDLSTLDAASSGDLGFGLGSGGHSGAGTPPPQPGRQAIQKHANTKRCVGRPARQTQDPLSPPCVPFFDGDNGGATATGVTGDEVTAVVIYDATSSSEQPGFVDWLDPSTTNDAVIDQLGKAFTRYFNDRYQLYGRRLHLYRYHIAPGTTTPETLRAAVGDVQDRKRPFAVIPAVTLGAQVVADEASHRKMVTASFDAFARRDYASVAPYLLSFTPDLENQAEQTVSFVCSKLNGRPARFAGDTTMHDRVRSVGVFYEQSVNAPNLETLARLIGDGMQHRCGINAPMAYASADSPQQAATTYTQAAVELSRAGVTTVIDVARGGVSGTMSRNAASAGYFPEWVVPGGGTDHAGPDRVTSAQLHNSTEWKAAFGISFDLRRDAVDQQAWHQAFREGCPNCPENFHSDAPVFYDALSLLLYGIQSAGPQLTAANIDKGLHAIKPRKSADPYAPAAYFTPGNWSFVKDAMEIWWDPSGQPPGDNRAGCYRLVDRGLRSRADDWNGDDSELFAGQPPCQGVAQRVRT